MTKSAIFDVVCAASKDAQADIACFETADFVVLLSMTRVEIAANLHARETNVR